MTLILNGTDNNVSIPAIQGGTGGTSAGVYYPAANTVAIVTSGANALTINSTQAATFASTVTVTGALTATGGVVQGANAAPAFSAYASSTTSIPNNAFTKVAFQTEEFDTNSNFDSSTNYRFTPTVAGYYQITLQIQFNSAPNSVWCSIYKNGSRFKEPGTQGGAGAYIFGTGLSVLIYLNGSTDYVEGYAYQNSGGALNVGTGAATTYFQGFLARSA